MQFKALESFATPRQLEYIEALRSNDSKEAAAESLGVSPKTLDRSLQALRAVAALKGHAPGHFDNGVAPGYVMGKVTVQRGPDGTPERTWERQSPDDLLRQTRLQEALEAMCEEITPVEPTTAPSITTSNLTNVYTMTDCHVGMLAWRMEGGEDWDLKIAEDTLVGCFEQMVLAAPAAHTCVIAQLGDFLHYDSALSPVTPMHGHILDADGRMPKMVKVAIRILRKLVAFALKKHKKVILLLAEGNHDISSSVWLRAMFAALYELEERVEVIDSELPYYVYQHGKTMLGWHHGHLKKNDQLPLLFASQFPVIWGNTLKRYCHTGHRHHKEIKEHSGMTVQQHQTIAARDSHSSRGGWMSERAVEAITYHHEYGQVGSITIVPEMLELAV